jgi:hypothetical protein
MRQRRVSSHMSPRMPQHVQRRSSQSTICNPAIPRMVLPPTPALHVPPPCFTPNYIDFPGNRSIERRIEDVATVIQDYGVCIHHPAAVRARANTYPGTHSTAIIPLEPIPPGECAGPRLQTKSTRRTIAPTLDLRDGGMSLEVAALPASRYNQDDIRPVLTRRQSMS